MISRLEIYREQSCEFDTNIFNRKEFKESPTVGKRRLIQSHLRDRLFRNFAPQPAYLFSRHFRH